MIRLIRWLASLVGCAAEIADGGGKGAARPSLEEMSAGERRARRAARRAARRDARRSR